MNHRIFIVSVFALLSILIFIQADRRFGYTSASPKKNYNVISDGTGYYAYLPQYIVYKDSSRFSFHSYITKKYPEAEFFIMLQSSDSQPNKKYNKFYVGTAFVQAPFYAIAHIFHLLLYDESDGYSIGYRFSIQLAALFYWLIGVVALFSLFRRLNYSNFTILLGIVCLTFGTNLNYYLAYYVSYSHIYSFAFIALFLNYAQLWSKTNQFKHLILLTFFLSIIAIIRPVNVVIILMLPLFFKNWSTFIKALKQLLSKRFHQLFASVCVFCAVIFIQLFVHYHQTSHWELYSYNEEGFSNLFHPQIWNILFSYSKGFFIYAPIMLLMLLGILMLYKKNSKYFFFGWIISVSVSLILVSSWWDWTYGGGLGIRVLIDYMPLYLFALLPVFEHKNKIYTSILSLFIVCAIYLYQVFQIQYNQNIILYSGMNKTKFWKVFLKTDGRYSWMLLYEYEKLPQKKLEEIETINYKSGKWQVKSMKEIPFLIKERKDEIVLINTGKGVSLLGSLEGEVMIYDGVNNPTIVAHYFNKGEEIYKSEQPFGNQLDKTHEFGKIRIEFNPNIPHQVDSVRLTLLHHGQKNDYRNLRFKLLK